jgi:hypothetical protein
MDALSGVYADTLRWWVYRVSDWIALHLLDDPAWLALMFC